MKDLMNAAVAFYLAGVGLVAAGVWMGLGIELALVWLGIASLVMGGALATHHADRLTQERRERDQVRARGIMR